MTLLDAVQNTDSRRGWWRSSPERRITHTARLQNWDSKNRYEWDLLWQVYEKAAEQILAHRIETWADETALKSVTSATRHPLFAEIVREGRPALKLVLERMSAGDVRAHWFPLLFDLSGGHDPVPPHKRGYIPDMARDWLTWGRETKLISS